MSDESKCPVHKHNPLQGTTNKDWWPNQINLDILHQHSTKSNPMDESFNYREEFKKLNLASVKKDLHELIVLLGFSPNL